MTGKRLVDCNKLVPVNGRKIHGQERNPHYGYFLIIILPPWVPSVPCGIPPPPGVPPFWWRSNYLTDVCLFSPSKSQYPMKTTIPAKHSRMSLMTESHSFEAPDRYQTFDTKGARAATLIIPRVYPDQNLCGFIRCRQRRWEGRKARREGDWYE